MKLTATFTALPALLLTLALAACAVSVPLPGQDTSSPPPPTPAAPLTAPTTQAGQPVHTIGLISGLGNQINFVKRGFTVFGNATSTGDVTDWHVDQLMLDDLKAALPEYSVVATRAVPSDAVFPIGDLMSSLFTNHEQKAIDALLANQPRQADLWLVVGPICESDGSTLPPGCGLNLFRADLLNIPIVKMSVYARITVIDGATHKVVNTSKLLTHGHDGDDNWPGLPLIGDIRPGTTLTSDFAVNQWSDYNKEGLDELHQELVRFLPYGVNHTLQLLRLNQ